MITETNRKPIFIKSRREIEGIRKSCRLAAQALDMIEPFITAGISTLALNEKIAGFIEDNGAVAAPLNYCGYPKETCISLNEVICHGIPDETILKEGDILNIDVTTILNGFYGDTSRMFTVGKISEEASELLKVTKRCLEIGIEQVKPGNKTGLIGYHIAEYAKLKGYSVVNQFCGHGVGVEFHENPQIPHEAKKRDGVVMREGMTFTIEPMINVGKAEAVIDELDEWTARTCDGALSAQYEHTVLVTEEGVEILTLSEEL
jgi:methionyl aminopeptidase